PNPKRVAAGKRNQLKSRGLTPAGRARLRETVLAARPWAHSTGPRTPEGQARVAPNGTGRPPNLHRREAGDRVADGGDVAAAMAALRHELQEGPGRLRQGLGTTLPGFHRV